MKGYKIYNYQRDVLVQQTMEGTGKYNPVKDHKGDYFIFEQEFKQCGLCIDWICTTNSNRNNIIMVNSRYKLKTGEEVAPFPPIQNNETI